MNAARCAGRRRVPAALGVALAGLSLLPGPAPAAATARAARRAYVVDCAGQLAGIDLVSAKVLRRRSLSEELPEATQLAGCTVTWPRLEAGELLFEMSQGGFADELPCRDVRVNVAAGRVTPLSGVHTVGNSMSAGAIPAELASGAAPAGRALAPFTQVDADGRRIVLAGDAARRSRAAPAPR